MRSIKFALALACVMCALAPARGDGCGSAEAQECHAKHARIQHMSLWVGGRAIFDRAKLPTAERVPPRRCTPRRRYLVGSPSSTRE